MNIKYMFSMIINMVSTTILVSKLKKIIKKHKLKREERYIKSRLNIEKNIKTKYSNTTIIKNFRNRSNSI